ncbi:MAG: molecular chaperone DnaK [Myxococcota bacterium]
MPHVIGIDLGTTNCCVAVVEDGSPKVILNRVGYPTTPSIVAVTEAGQRVVGQIASRQAITNPENTVYAAKRLIGRTFDAPQVQHAIEHASYGIEQGPHNDVRVLLGGKSYSVPELSAMLLQEMRVVAEEYLSERVDQAVVTVPAYFNDSQRQAVRDAGRIAGLDVLRIINEPTAAALAYGFKKGQERTIAVYDLGGGTFDISLVHISADGEYTVVATTGDSYLGGEDFDERVMDWLIEGFQTEHGVNLRESKVALQRLKQAAQKAKCDLSTVENVDVQLPFIAEGPAGPLNMDYNINREQLEKLTGDLITRTLRICEMAMRHAELQPQNIDEVILVGGMTRMPAVQWSVKEFFDREPGKSVHPDEVVALGAAIQAAALSETVDDVSLRDVTAHSLGIMTFGGGFDVIIPSNTVVPTHLVNEFTTSRDFQDTVKIVILQGESEKAMDNELLGQFSLSGIRQAKAGQVTVEVSFNINSDGIFSVAARDTDTGEQQAISVTGSSGLTEEEILQMMEESAQFLAERREQERHERVRQTAESVIAELERLMPEAAALPDAVGLVSKARDAVERSRDSLRSNDIESLSSAIDDLEGMKGALERELNTA